MAWTDVYSREQFKSVLRDLIEIKGMSARQAAEIIGHGVTRNAIIGFCHRNKIEFGAQRGLVPALPGKSPRFTGRPVGIMALSDMTCRAPLWDHGLHRLRDKVKPSEIMFCGHKVAPGSRYCAEHHAAFHTALEPTKKNKAVLDRNEAQIKAMKRWG